MLVGGSDSPLIVVGNAQRDNTRHPSSQWCDVQGKGILSMYNIGTEVDIRYTEYGRHE